MSRRWLRDTPACYGLRVGRLRLLTRLLPALIEFVFTLPQPAPRLSSEIVNVKVLLCRPVWQAGHALLHRRAFLLDKSAMRTTLRARLHSRVLRFGFVPSPIGHQLRTRIHRLTVDHPAGKAGGSASPLFGLGMSERTWRKKERPEPRTVSGHGTGAG